MYSVVASRSRCTLYAGRVALRHSHVTPTDDSCTHDSTELYTVLCIAENAAQSTDIRRLTFYTAVHLVVDLGIPTSYIGHSS